MERTYSECSVHSQGEETGLEEGLLDGKVVGFEVAVKLAKPSGQQGRLIAQ